MNWLRGLFEADVAHAFREAANKGDIASLAKAMGKQYEQNTIYNRILSPMEESARQNQDRRALELEERMLRQRENDLRRRERLLKEESEKLSKRFGYFSNFDNDERSAIRIK